MQILEAYCVELARVVDIYEARDEYFSQPEPKRRFRFECSDVVCRSQMEPLIVGANYTKHVENEAVFRRPYFRSEDAHPHDESCVWLTAHRKAMRTDTGADATRVEVQKASNHIDSFDPKNADPMAVVQRSSLVKVTADVDTDLAGVSGPDYETRSRTTTSRLERLVDDYEALSIEERKCVQVTIAGRTFNLCSAILPIRLIRQNEFSQRVVFGNAKVSAWPKETPVGFFIDFYEKLVKFPTPISEFPLKIWLPILRLEKYRSGKLLVERLKAAATKGHYARIYFYGTLNLHDEEKQKLDIVINSLDSLVVKTVVTKGAMSREES